MKIPKVKVKVTIGKGDRVTIRNTDDVVSVLRKVFDADTIEWTEEMIMLCMNRANEVIGCYKVSGGGMTGVVCDPKVVFSVALQSAACYIILAHNHPSGNLKPSDADIRVTEKIRKAGELLDIQLLDHIIMTKDNYKSII